MFLRSLNLSTKCRGIGFDEIIPKHRVFTRQLHRLKGTRISTLDPAKLTPADHVDLSEKLQQALLFTSLSGPRHYMIGYSHTNGHAKKMPYPSNTKGFFVYQSPYPDKVPELGRVVFRLVPTPDPSLVFTAPLYHRPDAGQPWSIPLMNMSFKKSDKVLVKQLIHDELVTPALLDSCRQLTENLKPNRLSTILCSLDQPWLFDFSQGKQCIYTLGHGRLSTCNLGWISRYEFTMPGHTFQRALSGRAYVKFEEIEKRLYIRVVEIVEPIRSTVGDNAIVDYYAPGAYIPFQLVAPLLYKKAIVSEPNPKAITTSPHYRHTSFDHGATPWFADPFDFANRDVELMKGLRLLMDTPLTEWEKTVFDQPKEKRLRRLSETEQPEEPVESEKEQKVNEEEKTT